MTQALRAAADRMVDLIADPRPSSSESLTPEAAPLDDLQALAASGAWQGAGDTDAEQIGDDAVDMAVSWLALLRHEPASAASVQCALAGAAVAVLVCAVPG